MRISPIFTVALAVALAPVSGRAASSDRYQITQAEGGFLRLDRESGAASFCSPSGDGYACRPATDAERRAENAASSIEKRLAAIEQRLDRIEGGKPAGAPGAGPATGPSVELPSDEQIDRAASFVQRALKRLKEIAQDMQKQEEVDRQRL